MFLSACVLALLPAAGAGPGVTSVSPTADGKLLFVANGGEPRADNGRVSVWDLTKPELKAVVTGLPGEKYTVRPTADGKRFVVVAGNDYSVSRIEVWDTTAKKRSHSFDVSAKDAGAASVSPDGNWVTYRAYRDKPGPQIWNTDTGERAEAVEKAIGKAEGAVAFTADSKRLIVLTDADYTEYDLATGAAAKTWKHAVPARTYLESAYGRWVAVLPDGKGAVLVGATGKRRQSYVVHLRTEKQGWFLGEFWDHATPPVVSPDGRLLIVSGGGRPETPGTFVLKLDADGAPELEDEPKKPIGPFVPDSEKKVPAWRAWPLGEPVDRIGRAIPEKELPAAIAFAPDGKRLFVAGTLGRVHVHDIERRVPKATLFAARPAQADAVPGWHIVTAAGEFVGTPAEAEALANSGKVKDATKVKEALGVK